MALPPVDAALREFKPEDYTPRLVTGLFQVVPYSPAIVPYAAVEDALKAIKPGFQPLDIAKARAASVRPEVQNILWMGNIIDKADGGYAAFTGIQAAWSMFSGKKDALETDSQQRNDAILKALGLAYLAWQTSDGTIPERVERFRTLPAGQALMTWYAAVEIVLPFTDNLAASGPGFVATLLGQAGGQMGRLAELTGGKDVAAALPMLQGLSGGISRVVDHVGQYSGPITKTVQQYAPSALAGADKVAGVAANAADLLPVYRYLSGRLAAESAVVRAG